MKSEEVCEKCGSQMEQITRDGIIISSEIKESKIIVDPNVQTIPNTYWCKKCGHVK